MNIDSSSLSPLFSPTESLEGFQQGLLQEGEISQEFASVLMQKLTQLKNMELDENFTLNLSDQENTLHELAGLLNEKGGLSDFSRLFGKNLPVAGKLENDIDLEDTLQALKNVMNTLGEAVEEESDLDLGVADEASLEDKLNNLFFPSWSKTSEIVAEKKEVLKEKLEIKIQQDKIEEQDDELLIASQMAAIVELMDEPLETESKTILPVGQNSETVNKKDPLQFKQVIEEGKISITDEEDTDALLKQDNSFRKFSQENPIIVAKQNENTEMTDVAEFELSKGRVGPKFATDIANLNRAVMYETKAEIPPMTKHFAHPEWNKEIGERVIWMHKQEIPSAELRLNPRHLGPVTIKIDVTQDQANISFIAQHAAVKEAIDAAIPKLREMFSAQQLNLADVNVTQDDTSQKQSRGFDQMGNDSNKRGDGNNENEMSNVETHEHTMDIAEEIEAGRAIASNGILSIFA